MPRQQVALTRTGILGCAGYINADAEEVANSFSIAAMVGIRSLPNALAPHFRQQLYQELVFTGASPFSQAFEQCVKSNPAHALQRTARQ
jgi:hypothetical protein